MLASLVPETSVVYLCVRGSVWFSRQIGARLGWFFGLSGVWLPWGNVGQFGVFVWLRLLVPAVWGDVCRRRLPLPVFGGFSFRWGGSGCVGLVWGCGRVLLFFWGVVCYLYVCLCFSSARSNEYWFSYRGHLFSPTFRCLIIRCLTICCFIILYFINLCSMFVLYWIILFGPYWAIAEVNKPCADPLAIAH